MTLLVTFFRIKKDRVGILKILKIKIPKDIHKEDDNFL